MTDKKYLVLFFMCTIYILSFFHRVCPAVITSELIHDLALTVTDLTLISSATMLTYGFMQLPSGILADAIGAKKTIVFMSLVSGICAIIFAFSDSLFSAVFARFLVGIGLAVTVPAMTLLAICFPKESYARANSILLCCGGLGGILAAPPLLFLTDMFSWRIAIAFFGVLTLFVGLLIVIFIPDSHKNTSHKVSVKGIFLGLKEVASTRAFWPLALWQMFMFSAFFALSSLWWGPYLMEGNGYTKGQVSFILTVASITLMCSQPIIATLSDVYFKARKKPIMYISLTGILTSSVWVFFTGEISFTLMVIQTVFFMISVVSAAPLAFTMTKEMFPPRLTGTAIGFLNMFYPIWIGVTQMLYGQVLDWQFALNVSPERAFSIASLVIVGHIFCGCICTFFMKETYQTQKE